MAKLQILTGVAENLNIARATQGKYGSIHTARFTVGGIPVQYKIQFSVLQKETFPIAEGDKITVAGHVRDETGMVGEVAHIERTNQFLGGNWLLPMATLIPCGVGTLFVASSLLKSSFRSAPGHWDAYVLGAVGVGLATGGLWLTAQAWRPAAMVRSVVNAV